jgi:hypothetical protein
MSSTLSPMLANPALLAKIAQEATISTYQLTPHLEAVLASKTFRRLAANLPDPDAACGWCGWKPCRENCLNLKFSSR